MNSAIIVFSKLDPNVTSITCWQFWGNKQSFFIFQFQSDVVQRGVSLTSGAPEALEQPRTSSQAQEAWPESSRTTAAQNTNTPQIVKTAGPTQKPFSLFSSQFLFTCQDETQEDWPERHDGGEFYFCFPNLGVFLYLWKVVHVVVYVFLLFVTFCIFGIFPLYDRRIRSIKSNWIRCQYVDVRSCPLLC